MSRIVDQLQDNIESTLDKLTANPFVDGVQVTSVSLAAGQDNYVNHGLGHAFQGWWITDRDGMGEVWQSATTNKSPELYVILQTSVNVIVDLWIF
jgi:hypothetical protein